MSTLNIDLTVVLTIPPSSHPIPSHTTMASLWYCCGCNFGPHNSALYDACINCGSRRCRQCVDEKVSMRLNTNSDETSPYPSVVALDTAHTLSLDTQKGLSIMTADAELPEIRPLSRQGHAALPSRLGGSQLYSQTYMYVCCQCRDGPKVYNVQPVCVVCNHKACSCCTYVK